MQLAGFQIQGPPSKATGLGNDNPVRISVRQFDVGCYTKRAVLYIDKGIFRYAVHTRINSQRSAVAYQVRSPCYGSIEPFRPAIIDRQDMVLFCYLHEEILHFLEFRWVLRREIVRLTKVFIHIIQFPDIVFYWWQWYHQPAHGTP